MKKFYSLCILIGLSLCLSSQTVFMNYPLDGSADDVSTNNYDGTVMGPTLTTNRYSQPNRAYSFDGVNDYIDLGMVNAMNDILTSFTVSFWMKSSNVGVSNYYEVLGNINSPGAGLSMNIDVHRTVFTSLALNSILFYLRDNASQTFCFTVTDSTIFDDNWHCLVFKINSVATGGAEVYLDGVLHTHTVDFNEAPNMTLTDFEFPFMLGALNNRGTLQSFFNGSLDQFKIYDYAVNASTILSDCSTNLAGNEDVPVQIIKGVKIFPNPATKVLNIQNQNEALTQMTVYDMNGSMIIQSNIHTLDVANYAPGMYLIIFEDEQRTIRKEYKFMME